MGSRGQSSNKGGGGGLNPGNIVSMSNLRVSNKIDEKTYSEISNALNDFASEYGSDVRNTREAVLKGKDKNALAFYDGEGIAFNSDYMESNAMNEAMDRCIAAGFHPPRGNKSGLEAVAAHELGHQLNDMIAQRQGRPRILGGMAWTAEDIVKEASKQFGYKGLRQFRKSISGYAETNNKEAIAEACADVYCNGSKAKAESKAIMTIVDRYLKK